MTYFLLSQGKKVFLSLFIICLFTALSAPVSMPWAMDNSAAKTQKDMPAMGAASPAVAQMLINTLGSKLFIIDVREADEFARGHIPKAVNIPLDTVASSLGKIPTDKPVLIVCRTGIRAKKAWGVIHVVRPTQKDIWFLKGTPEYKKDGSYKFNASATTTTKK